MVRYAKAVNLFEALTQAVLEESERGETVRRADFAREHDLDLAALRAERDADADSGVRCTQWSSLFARRKASRGVRESRVQEASRRTVPFWGGGLSTSNQ